MKIVKGIEIIGKSLLLEKSKTLIIADLHIGYEESLNKRGILVPRTQFKEMFKELEDLLSKVRPKAIVINGDLKHEFSDISEQEWNEALKILDLLLKYGEIILVKGNHDNILEPIAKKRGLKIVDKYKINSVCVVHGNSIIETSAKTLIIGHEHPAISLQDVMKTEKYKCFLLGKWKNKQLIVMPSFMPMIEGTDLMQEKPLSPYLKNIKNSEVFIVGDKVYRFGKLKNIK